MRHLKTFENHNNYEDFTETEAFVKPNVSYCIQLNEVHYNSLADPRLIVRYNVTDASLLTSLYDYHPNVNSIGTVMFDKIEIDGVEVSITDLDSANGQTQLSAGEHTVKYTLKDPTFIGVKFGEDLEISAIFRNCMNVISVKIPSSVIIIGGSVFSNCSNLSSIIIPNSVTSIVMNAFSGCTSLTSVTIPSSVLSIEDYAFCGCSSLDTSSRLAIETINSNATQCQMPS